MPKKKSTLKKEEEGGLFLCEVIRNKQTKIKSFFQFKILILLLNSQASLLTLSNSNTTEDKNPSVCLVERHKRHHSCIMIIQNLTYLVMRSSAVDSN